jgi:hypothetical protein
VAYPCGDGAWGLAEAESEFEFPEIIPQEKTSRRRSRASYAKMATLRGRSLECCLTDSFHRFPEKAANPRLVIATMAGALGEPFLESL